MKRNFGMRSGDRRKRWVESNSVSGVIMLLIGFALCTGGIYGIIFGTICIMIGIHDLITAQKGWKMTNERPPWADRNDAIRKKHGMEPFDIKNNDQKITKFKFISKNN